jgi:SEC-C motif-containing protein
MARPACPCGSGAPLATCCGPVVEGRVEALDATALMRSRYVAFATGRAEHLWRTLHPGHSDRARPADEVMLALRRACRTQRFRGLSVLDAAPPDGQGLARVLFFARVFESGRDLSFVECSRFALDAGAWRYLDGQAALASRWRDPAALRLDTFDVAEPE